MLDWDRLRPGTDIRQSFEGLCCHLAAQEDAPAGSSFYRLRPPDGGVECLWRLPDGSEQGWQAKYFRTGPDAGQWGQIDKSVRRALDEHPCLKRYVVCLPTDRTRGGATGWDGRVKKWKARRDIDYVYWGGREIETRLMRPGNEGLLKYYFDKEFLSREWAKRAVTAAIENAGPRYTPALNVDLPIARRFDALCGTPEFFDRLGKAANEIRDRLSYASTAAALEACGGKFAELGSLIESVCGMLRPGGGREDAAIDAGKIREEAVRAEGLIGEIVPDLSRAEGAGAPPQQAAAAGRRPAAPLDAEKRDLMRLYDILRHTVRGELLEDMEIHGAGALLVSGDAGVGKTHLFCDVARRRNDKGSVTALLHGSHFRGEPPCRTIVAELDLDCAFAELLGGLDAAGRAGCSRSLLMIDALNEGDGERTWKTHLGGILSAAARFPHVALAVSVRTRYEQEVVPPEIGPQALRRVVHRGFEGRTEDALARFFDGNGISRPSVPPMTPEFSNPQFLTVLCRALKNKNMGGMPEDVGGISGVYDLLVDSVNDRLSAPDRLDAPRDLGLVQTAVGAFAGRLAERDADSMEYAEAHDLLAEAGRRAGRPQRLLEGLISEGVMAAYAVRSKGGGTAKMVRFAYERMSDNLVVKSLLDAASSAEEAGRMLEGDGPLAAYLADPARRGGLLDALSAQLPERFGRELHELAPSAHADALSGPFLDSLAWRSPRSIGRAAVQAVDGMLKSGKPSHALLRTLLMHSTDPRSPLNAEYLHRHLLGLGMGERDRRLATFLHEDYTRDPHSIVGRHIRWAWKEGKNFGDDVVRLAGITLGWFLTSSNRYVRDRATKALVAMLTGREGVLVDVMSRFEACNDPYVAECLFCAAYGCAMRGRSAAGLKKLAAHAYGSVFRSGSPPPDIMLRDYARGIILLADHRGAGLGFDPAEYSPPHNSGWIDDFPSEDDIKSLQKKHGTGGRGPSGAASIFSSLSPWGDFYRYVIGEDPGSIPWINVRLPADGTTWAEALGEFDRSVTPDQKDLWASLRSLLSERTRNGIVTIREDAGGTTTSIASYGGLLGDLAGEFEPLLDPGQAAAFRGAILPHLEYSLNPASDRYRHDPMRFARWIARRVFELGWTGARFEKYDAALSWERDPQNGAERTGKKYQWIAYHELLARLCDNHEFSDPDAFGRASAYESTAQLPSARDLDPSMTYYIAPYGAARPGPRGGGLSLPRYKGWEAVPDDDDWLREASDLPEFDSILSMADGGGARWLALDMFTTRQHPQYYPTPRSHPHRRVDLLATSAVVEKRHGPELDRLVHCKSLERLRFPDRVKYDEAFLGELYWGARLQGGLRAGDHDECTITSGDPADYVSARSTTYEYRAERGDPDFSLNDNITLLLPSRFLATGMNLTNMNDGTFNDEDGACAACDAAAGDRGSRMLLARQDALAEFLERGGYEVFWRTAACKYVVGEHGAGRSGKPSSSAVHSVYRLTKGGLDLVRRDAHVR